MSLQLFKQDVLFYQRFLKSNGFYKSTLDGDWGGKTDAADAAFIAETQSIAQMYGTFNNRSEDNIKTLAPKAQILARRFLNALSNFDVRIISGTRTYAEQNALYRKGRYGNTEQKVTNAKGGQSNHNFGIAWDIGLFENGSYITSDLKYRELAAIVLPQIPALEWGGNWLTFQDSPHYQLPAVSNKISEIKKLFEAGNAIV
jgi:peptidoglycan L-alanyl-D-glutamate endopeptidase CwlK